MIIKGNNAIQHLLLLVVLVLISLIFTKYYFLLTNEYYPPAYAYKIANFEADKVFQKRFLIPIFADFLSKNSLFSFDKSLKLITVLCTFGLLYYFKKLLEIFSNGISSHYWCLLLLIPVGWNYMFINSIYHAYDIPSLFFFCACLYLFLNKNYILFYITFTIATLNRESTCFITVSLVLLLYKIKFDYSLKSNFLRNTYLIKHILIQTTLWSSVVLLISWLLKNSPGYSYESTYSMKIFISNLWKGLPSWPFLNTDDFFCNPRCFITLFGCTWLLIPFLWKYVPMDCKKLLLLIPIYMIPAILYANLMETRIYHELNVIISLAVISGFLQFKNSLKLNAVAKV